MVVEVLEEVGRVGVGKRSNNPKKFLSKEEQQKIVEAIKEVEKNTVSEIKIHIAKKIKRDIIEEAKIVFSKLGMANTRYRNAVLLFFVIEDRAFAIIGDKGIDEKVIKGFWEDIAQNMEEFFKKNLFGEGIVFAIKKVGEILRTFFPYKEGDINELPDEISFG